MLLFFNFKSAGLSPTPVADPLRVLSVSENKAVWLLYWVTLLAQSCSFPAAGKDEMPTACLGFYRACL